MRLVLVTLALELSGLAWAIPAVAKDAPARFAPTAPWTANFADDSCALERTFASGSDTLFLRLRQYVPGDNFEITLASETLNVRRGKTVTFTPGSSEQKIDSYQSFDVSHGLSGVVFTAPLLKDRSSEDEGRSYFAVYDDAQNISGLTVTNVFGPEVALVTGPLREPLKVLEDCLDGLLTSLGLDASAHRSLLRQVTEIGDNEWPRRLQEPQIRFIRQWPSDVILFRLLVDEQGHIFDCHIPSSEERRELARNICDSLPKDYEFLPALDAQGRPVKSFHNAAITRITRRY
jgi:hypothetical protein